MAYNNLTVKESEEYDYLLDKYFYAATVNKAEWTRLNDLQDKRYKGIKKLKY